MLNVSRQHSFLVLVLVMFVSVVLSFVIGQNSGWIAATQATKTAAAEATRMAAVEATRTAIAESTRTAEAAAAAQATAAAEATSQTAAAEATRVAAVKATLSAMPISYGRGVGIPMGCGTDEDQNGALCYPKCAAGFVGDGPVCWQQCPSGFRNDGAFCAKPEAYGRGAGYVLWDEEKCRRENGNCEKVGALWYPVCREGYQAFGANICSPICPAGMTDIGVSCTKQSRDRTAGVPLHTCPEGMEGDAGLCYPVCMEGYKGVGPVCWKEKS